MLPVCLTLVPASVIVGAVITRRASYRWAAFIGWILTTLGVGLMCSWKRGTSTAAWAIELIILGVGIGFNLNALNTACQATCRPGDEGRAVGMYAFLRSFGMAVGVGISGSVFQNVMEAKLRSLGLPASIARNAEAYIQLIKHQPESPQRNDIIMAYIAGLHGVYGFVTGLSGLALIACLFMKHYEMNKDIITDHKLTADRVSWRFSRGPAGMTTDSATSTNTDSSEKELSPRVSRPLSMATAGTHETTQDVELQRPARTLSRATATTIKSRLSIRSQRARPLSTASAVTFKSAKEEPLKTPVEMAESSSSSEPSSSESSSRPSQELAPVETHTSI
jgi:hypothetical protein